MVEFLEVEPVISDVDVEIIGFDFGALDVCSVVLVVVLSSFFTGVVTVVVDVAIASVMVFLAAAVLVLAVGVVRSILVAVFVSAAVVGNIVSGVVVNVVVGFGEIKDLLNCVTGSSKETQNGYEKVNFFVTI